MEHVRRHTSQLHNPSRMHAWKRQPNYSRRTSSTPPKSLLQRCHGQPKGRAREVPYDRCVVRQKDRVGVLQNRLPSTPGACTTRVQFCRRMPSQKMSLRNNNTSSTSYSGHFSPRVLRAAPFTFKFPFTCRHSGHLYYKVCMVFGAPSQVLEGGRSYC